MSSPEGEIPNAVFSTFVFLGFLACAIPFPWHLEAWNTGTCLYMFWAGLACLNLFVNSIIWNGNAINWAPVWCDISTRIIVATHFAIPAASLCINRRLYHIASSQAVTVSRAEKRKAVIADLAIAFGYPCLMVALHHIVQGHRFDIIEDFGCFATTYNVTVAFVLVYTHPLLSGLISLVYCLLTLRVCAQRHARLAKTLFPHRNLTPNRYSRLRCLAATELIATIPLASWLLASAVRGGTEPWISWEETHYDFFRVDVIPAVVWRRVPSIILVVEFTRWAPVLCAFVFFAFFGFDHEARRNYRSVVGRMAERAQYSTSNANISRSPEVFVLTDVSVSMYDDGDVSEDKEKDISSSSDLSTKTSNSSLPNESGKASDHSPV